MFVDVTAFTAVSAVAVAVAITGCLSHEMRYEKKVSLFVYFIFYNDDD